MPERCPECGRFLAADFVEGLAAEPSPCPRCEVVLGPEHFSDIEQQVQGTEEALATTPDATSVRPPDLPPAAVRSRSDVLAGWDEPHGARSSLAEEIVAGDNLGLVATIIGAGVVGGLVAGLAASRRRPAWTVAGTVAGAALAVLGTRVLEEQEMFDE